MKALIVAMIAGLLLCISGIVALSFGLRDERERSEYRLCLQTKENREALRKLVFVIPEPIRASYAVKLQPPIICHRP